MSKLKYQSVLVTGGAGFIGSHFIKLLFDVLPDVRVVNLDLLTYAGSLDNVASLAFHPQYHFIHGDIGDAALLDRVLREHEINLIVNFAAESHVDRSIAGPATFVQTNIVGTFVLLEAAKKYWLSEKKWDKNNCRFHHISTDEVYGALSFESPAFTEKTLYQPNSPYSASKASADHLVRAYQHTYGLPTSLSNCSNNYGPFQHPEKLIPTIIDHCYHQTPIPIYGSGENVRDWLHVLDHCRAVLQIIQSDQIDEVYVIGGDNTWSNLDLAKRICARMDARYPNRKPHADLITFVDDRLGHDLRYAIDAQKLKQTLGWQPQIDFDAGLDETIEFYLARA